MSGRQNLREIRGVARYESRRVLSSARLRLLLAALAMLVHLYASPIRAFSAAFDERVSPLPLFVGLTGTNASQNLLHLLWIYLICDAPFVDAAHTYVLLRCGRRNHMLGVMAYLLLCSCAYWAVVLLASVLVMAGRLEWSGEWGRVYYSLARVYGTGSRLTFQAPLQKLLSAPQAAALSFLLQVCCSYALSLLVVLGNRLARRLGVLLAVGLVLFDRMFFWFGLPYVWMHASPVTLANLQALDLQAASYHPSLRYALTALSLFTLALSAACLIAACIPREQAYRRRRARSTGSTGGENRRPA